MLKLPIIQDECGRTSHELPPEKIVSSAIRNVVFSQLSHPDVRSFLQPRSGFESATCAYDKAISDLGIHFTTNELGNISSNCSIQEVHAVALEAQKKCQGGPTKQKVMRFVQVLDHYSSVMDVLSQAHAEYTCLIWGSMKWLLQLSMNYFNLLQRLSSMLSDIGHNLPRFLFYQRILPTNRIASVCCELYVAILEFLHKTIVFFRRRKLRKYLSALWSPFEIKFKETVENIHRLQHCLESDAHATAVAQQKIDNDDTLQSVQEIKTIQVSLLLATLRSDLFFGNRTHVSFHDDVLRLTNSTRASDWTYWFSEDRRYVPWEFHKSSQIMQAQCDTIQTHLTYFQMAEARKAVPKAVIVCVMWSPEMDARSALASLVFQVLQQRPDILLKKSPECYLFKFREGRACFEKLWTVFLELIDAVGGILCFVQLPSLSSHAVRFSQAFVDLFDSYDGVSGPLMNMVLYQSDHSSFPKRWDIRKPDDIYDVDPALDATDALHQVILAYSGAHEGLSDALRTGLWETLWRTVRYSAIALTRPQNASALNLEGSTADCEITAHFHRQMKEVPYHIPFDILEYLKDVIEQAIGPGTLQSVNSLHHEVTDKRAGFRLQPLSVEMRNAVWSCMRKMLIKSIMDAMREQAMVQLLNSGLENGMVKMVAAGIRDALAKGLFMLMSDDC